jgi:hypothetical protein
LSWWAVPVSWADSVSDVRKKVETRSPTIELVFTGSQAASVAVLGQGGVCEVRVFGGGVFAWRGEAITVKANR